MTGAAAPARPTEKAVTGGDGPGVPRPGSARLDAADLSAVDLDRVRRRLLGIGYRITGTWADAEDAADEALARWVEAGAGSRSGSRSGSSPGAASSGTSPSPGASSSPPRATESAPSPPRNPEAWLTTVVTRLCLDRLRRRAREDYVGQWLPEPVDTALLPEERAERRDDLRIAVLLAYEQLRPDERAAFVLREAYELPYAEIADILGAAVPTVRQWVSRARHRLDTDLRPPEPASDSVIGDLVTAVLSGDLDRTVEVLAADARALSDGGGRVNAALRDIVGARKCAYFLVKSMELAGGAVAPVEVNGETALAVFARGVLRVAQVGVVDGRVARLYFHANPDKLTRLVLPEGFVPAA